MGITLADARRMQKSACPIDDSHLSPLLLERHVAIRLKQDPFRLRRSVGYSAHASVQLRPRRKELFIHALVQYSNHLLNLLRCAHERWPKRDPVRIEATEQAILQGTPADFHAERVGEAFLCLPI